MSAVFRAMQESDLEEVYRVRMAVRENLLTDPSVAPVEKVLAVMAEGGSWVALQHGRLVGFTMATLVPEPLVWALFVEPEAEGRGIGRALFERVVVWLRAQGHGTATLSTDPGTRADGFYQRAGWRRGEVNELGEVVFSLPLER